MKAWMLNRTGLILLTCCCICFTGCSSTQTVEPKAANRKLSERYIAGLSIEFRPIEVEVYGHGADRVLILATIHGNENAGTPLLGKLKAYLETHPQLLDARTVTLVPVVNPDGFHHNKRYNMSGIDLNRNFPAKNHRTTKKQFGNRPLSEPESQALMRIVEDSRPHRVVSLHQPVDCIDYDGPADDLAKNMGDATGMKVKKIGARPGSLGSYVGNDMGVPIITYELPRDADKLSPEQLWVKYGPGLLAAVVFPDTPPAIEDHALTLADDEADDKAAN